jgi:hypothetical protein
LGGRHTTAHHVWLLGRVTPAVVGEISCFHLAVRSCSCVTSRKLTALFHVEKLMKCSTVYTVVKGTVILIFLKMKIDYAKAEVDAKFKPNIHLLKVLFLF